MRLLRGRLLLGRDYVKNDYVHMKTDYVKILL